MKLKSELCVFSASSGDRKQQHHIHLHRPGDELHGWCYHGVCQPDITGQQRRWRALRQSSSGAIGWMWHSERAQIFPTHRRARETHTCAGNDKPAPSAKPFCLNWTGAWFSCFISFLASRVLFHKNAVHLLNICIYSMFHVVLQSASICYNAKDLQWHNNLFVNSALGQAVIRKKMLMVFSQINSEDK